MEAGTQETPAVLLQEVCQVSSFSARLGIHVCTWSWQLVFYHSWNNAECSCVRGDCGHSPESLWKSCSLMAKMNSSFNTIWRRPTKRRRRRNSSNSATLKSLNGRPTRRTSKSWSSCDEEESPGGSPTHCRGAQGHSSPSLRKFHS